MVYSDSTGFVYDTQSHSEPTVTPDLSAYPNDIKDADVTIGAFQKLLESLTSETTYYFRAFTVYNDTAYYGTELSFTTGIDENTVVISNTETSDEVITAPAIGVDLNL